MAPRGSTFPRAPSHAISVPPSQSFFIAPPAEDTAFDVPTGITVPKGMSALMRITGLVSLDPNPKCPAGPAPSWMSWEGNGSGAGMGAEVRWFIGPFGGSRFGIGFSTDGKADSAVNVWSPDFADFNGEIIFHRAAGAPTLVLCSTGWPLYVVSGGGHDIRVDFVTVDVGASKTTIQANESVTFTGSPNNFVPLDPNAFYWSFYPEANPGSPISVDACTGQSTCTFTPLARGRMAAFILASGGAQVPGFSPTIEILCPTGDTILDSKAMRDLMKIAWDSSNAFDANKLNRRERAGYVIRDASGMLEYRTFFAATDTPCQAFNTPSGIPAGSFVAEFHTHPFTHLEETTGICTPAVQGVQKFYDAKGYGGPSQADFERGNNDQLPMYILDRDNIYSFPVGTSKTNWKTKVKKYLRIDPTGCVRP